MIRKFLVVVVLLIGAAGAWRILASDEGSTSRTPSGVVLFAGGVKESDEVGLEGKLGSRSGCVGVASLDGTHFTVVAFPGTARLVSESPLQLRHSGQTYEIGDPIDTGGSFVKWGAKSLPADVPKECRTHKIFVADGN